MNSRIMTSFPRNWLMIFNCMTPVQPTSLKTQNVTILGLEQVHLSYDLCILPRGEHLSFSAWEVAARISFGDLELVN